MTYIVHGATGAQGSSVATALIKAGRPVTAAVRNTSAFTSGPALAVDVSDIDSLASAYRDAEGVFVHLPLGSPTQQIQYAQAIAAAVDIARPARVVFSTSGYPLGDTDDSPHGLLMRGLQATGVSTAVIAPQLYLENLLLPPVFASAQEGLLPYPVRDDFRVSWASHLDVADVAVRLFERTDVTGLVAVGALPGLVGADLADGFTKYVGYQVNFHAQTPDEFGEMTIPLFGAEAMTPVIDSYRWRATQPNELIDESRSAQVLLGIQPRTVQQWLRDVNTN